MTSVFFLSLDYWADTMFLHFCLCLTSILSSLAVASFFLRSSIFLLATLKYFSSFSLFRPLLLPCATFTDDVPASDYDSVYYLVGSANKLFFF